MCFDLFYILLLFLNGVCSLLAGVCDLTGVLSLFVISALCLNLPRFVDVLFYFLMLCYILDGVCDVMLLLICTTDI